ncbi:MAG: DUF3887 domain-containing protein [Lachnotalea sp.]
MVKKLFTILGASILACALLMGCSSNKLASTFDEETVKTAAEEIVDLVNADDFDTLLNDKSNDEVKAAITSDQMVAAKKQIMDQAGAFTSYKSVVVMGDKKDDKDIAIVVLVAKYENKTVKYTIGFDENMKINTIYMS